MRVTTLEANIASMLVSVKAIQGEDKPNITRMVEYENVQDISPEDMMEKAIQDSERRAAFFKLPENKGKQDQFQKDMRYLNSMETWEGVEDFRDWLQTAVSWVSCVDFTMVTGAELKSALWRALPTEKRRFADTLKPGSMAFTHDTMKEYTRHMLDTFQPPRQGGQPFQRP